MVSRCWLLCVCLLLGLYPVAGAVAAERPALQLATKYRQDIDLKAYWVSEKLDGVRARWDPQRHQLISRQGHVFAAPHWFTAGFPDVALDGELWIGRAKFDLVSGIVRKKRGDHSGWQQIKLMVFDLPASRAVFSTRVEQMKTLVEQSGSAYLMMIRQQRLDHRQQLTKLLNQVVKQGGEGLMLHHGEARYQTKRSKDLMKLKQHQDAEAVVLKHLPGKGKFDGMLGALLVKTPDGVIFKIGSGFSDLERKNPPPIGSVISFKYYGKTANQVPRFASFWRLRAP